MMHVIRSFRVLAGRSIEFAWDDGVVSVVDFEPIIAKGGVFTPLAKEGLFGRAVLDDRGRVVSWPGNLEFCADALYEMGRVLIVS